MTGNLRVSSDELREVSSTWRAEVFELAAAPPVLDVAGGAPTMFAVAAVTGAAQEATAELHAGITGTAGATQVAASSYDANESDAVNAINTVISTGTNIVRENT